MKRLLTCNYESATDSKTNDSAIIIDLPFFLKSHAINKNAMLLEFADSLRKRILNKGSSCWKCDVIVDLYFKNNLKHNIWSSRGLGCRKHFNDETKISGDFRIDFLTNNDNKNDLQVYLAGKFVETPIFQKHVVIRYTDKHWEHYCWRWNFKLWHWRGASKNHMPPNKLC